LIEGSEFRLDSRQEHAGMTDSGGKQPGIKPQRLNADEKNSGIEDQPLST
jgi:hypothetical protein